MLGEMVLSGGRIPKGDAGGRSSVAGREGGDSIWGAPAPRKTMARVKPWPASLNAELKKKGFDLCAPFSTKWYNDEIAEAHLKMKGLPHFGRDAALCYVIGSNKSVWQYFLRHPPKSAFSDAPRNHAGRSAFDAFVEESVFEAIERAKCPPGLRRHYAFAHAMEHDVAFQRCAGLAALADVDPLTNLCVHPIFGSWVSLRCVVVFDAPPPAHHPKPVTALLTEEELDGCKAALERVADGGPGDWKDWLKVRDAIKRGKSWRFSDSHILYFWQGASRDKALRRALEHQVC